MKIRLVADDILKSSTTISKAKIGFMVVELCKSQLKGYNSKFTPSGEEKFLWDSFQKSKLIAEEISERSKILANARWNKERRKKQQEKSNG